MLPFVQHDKMRQWASHSEAQTKRLARNARRCYHTVHVWQHKTKQVDGFTKKYNIDRLIYYETFGDVWSAIAREKQIKGWIRKRKLDLIASMNREWRDLSEGWYDTDSEKSPRGIDLSS